MADGQKRVDGQNHHSVTGSAGMRSVAFHKLTPPQPD